MDSIESPIIGTALKVRTFANKANTLVWIKPNPDQPTTLNIVAFTPKDQCQLFDQVGPIAGDEVEVLSVESHTHPNGERILIATAMLADSCFTCAANILCNPYKTALVLTGND